jgi:MSHA biogenesis protein MshJ
MNPIKQRWKNFAAKIETLSLHERAMVAVAAIVAVVFLVYVALIDPALARERALQAVINQQRAQMSGIDAELAQLQAIAAVDPDLGAKSSLAQIKAENARMRTDLRTLQKGLVAPDKIAQLLEHMLQANGKLRLVSLKTLPPRGMSDGRFSEPVEVTDVPPPGATLSVVPPLAPGAAAAAANAVPRVPVKQDELLYRHGVQVVLQGSYLDMVSYMESLERLPAQLFWGKATLDAQEYPKARLTLTLYTLSLDTKWISL